MKHEGSSLGFLWSSPWTVWIGLRYLKSKKHSRFLSFITLLSILGVGLGVTSMIVVLSIMDGFEVELKKRLVFSDLHILITPTPEVPGFDGGFVPKGSLDKENKGDKGSDIKRMLNRNSEVESFWEVVSTEAILKTGRKVTGVVIKGVSAERLERLKFQVPDSQRTQGLGGDQRENHEKSGDSHIAGVYVGQELAYEIGLIPGDQISLISPVEMDGPLNSIPRVKRFVVEGIYHSGLPEQELHTLFAKDSAVRAFLRKADVVSQWEVTVRHFEEAPAIADKVRRGLPKFRVQDWNQMNAHLFASLRLERVAMFIILAFIVIVASFNIVTTLTLMVLEKKKEISILKAMGARSGQVAAIFLAEGILIGAVGVGGGTVIGFLLCLFLRRYEIIQLPDVFYERNLPVTFDPQYYIGVAFCALVIVLLACVYPSKRAAKLNPLEGIRFG